MYGNNVFSTSALNQTKDTAPAVGLKCRNINKDLVYID